MIGPLENCIKPPVSGKNSLDTIIQEKAGKADEGRDIQRVR